MFERRERLFGELVLFCDMLVLVVSVFLAVEVRILLTGAGFLGYGSHLLANLWVLWIAGPVYGVLLRICGLCSSKAYRSLTGIFTRLFQVQVGAALILMSMMYLGKIPESRIVSQTFLAAAFVLLLAEKISIRMLLIRRSLSRMPASRWKVLAIGSAQDVAEYMGILRTFPFWALELVDSIEWPEAVGEMSRTGTHGSAPLRAGTRARVSEGDWHRVLRRYVVDEVVAVLPWERSAGSESLAVACREKGITFRLLVKMPSVPIGTYHVEDLRRGAFMLSLETIPQLTSSLLIKRGIDIAAAIAGLLLCGITYLCYRLVLERQAPGPVIFKQQRVGQNGRLFTLFKFRTMYPDAEARLPELVKHNQMRGFMFKMENDPRVTLAGKWMRRRHLDELPQFWNVLKGEMSLVGTRPPTPSEVAQYQVHHHRRLSMKPGITGLWQLNGNGKVNDFEEVVKLDCDYIDNWSLPLDFKIIAKTTIKILRAAGW